MFKARLLTTLVSQPIRAGLSSSSQNSESRASETPLGTESDRSDASQSREKQSSSTGLEENVDAESASSPVPETSTTNAPPQNPVLDQGPSETRQLSAVESLLQERRRRLDVDKKAKEETEKAERKAKSEARKESVSKAPESVKAEQATYAQEQRRRQQEAKVARERILREIEHDKAERKEKEERRKALAQAEADGLLDEVTVPEKTKVSKPNLSDAKATENPQDTAPTSKPCAIQVRLFDGSTIRNRFPTSQTLKDIRDWVDSEKSDDIPYTFKQILTPLPNRPLTISEESESLSELGFFPSATLVTIPIQGYTAAYSEAGSGILSKGVSAGYNTVATGVGMLSGALGTFLGIGQATTQPAPPAEEAPQANNPERAHTTGGASINVRTLRDQRDPKTDHQLYNGNQVRSLRVRPLHSVGSLTLRS